MEKLYRLVFKGELLTGHDPAEIRSRASQRLGANTQQTARLFSGQSVILKRGLLMDAATRYAKELRSLGMRMHVELDADAAPKVVDDGARYRIVFQGELVPGFVPEQVMLAASERLHASAAQIATLFSGRKTTLKKGLDAEQARRYASRLRGIGMLVASEPESPVAALPEAPVVAVAPVVAPVMPEPVVPVVPAPAARVEEPDTGMHHAETLIHTPLMQASDLLHAVEGPVDMDFTQTMVDHELISTNAQQVLPDLEKTELAGEASLQAYMRGEPLPLEDTSEYVPPPQMPVRMPSPALAPMAVVVPDTAGIDAGRVALPTQPVRSCASCGARQPQGRYCIHCGHEFAREFRAPVAVAEKPAELPLAWLKEQEAVPAAASEQASRPGKGLLYLGLLLCFAGLAWWLLR